MHTNRYLGRAKNTEHFENVLTLLAHGRGRRLRLESRVIPNTRKKALARIEKRERRMLMDEY